MLRLILAYQTASLFLFVNNNAISVIVTGGTGILGRELVNSATSLGFDTYIGVRKPFQHMQGQFHSDFVQPFKFDLQTDSQVEYSISIDLPPLPLSSNIIIFNNAAVCLENSVPDALSKSIYVNCIGPSSLAQAIVADYCSKSNITVVNISSGDGELICLHSDIQTSLSRIGDMHVRTSTDFQINLK